ncbi:hypothetical protein CLV63_1209 [Murinocardiopsis flavida]|uniref:Uncharacterized protein n=1 Tax=Murinocardiopsis flavida TaxID=645275 RepID=A0A2P8D225_9ACTN|nr:hypothetical protein [Murinocardiopsis flavida]PSK91283.1 hypothetical protein CLV63_1209 [Murinocardiopsis flavida]
MAHTNPPDPGPHPWSAGPPSGPYPPPGPPGPPAGPQPPGPQWQQPPPPPPNRSRTAGIVIAVIAVVVVLGGGATAAVVLLAEPAVLTEPADPCPAIEDDIDASYSAEENDKLGYATCAWTLTDPDASGASGTGDTDQMHLTVGYEVISEPVGGASPDEIAGFLLKHNRERMDTDYVTIEDEEDVADLGDEAHHLYTVYSTEGYESGASTMQVRRANVLITVEMSAGSGGYDSMEAADESDLRPIVEDVSESALQQLEGRPA